MHEKIVLDTEMIDFMCMENEKDFAHFARQQIAECGLAADERR